MDTSAEYSAGLQFFAESIPHMVWMARPDGSIEYFNQRTLDYAGLSAEELYGRGWLKLIHPDDASLAEQTFGQACQNGGLYAAEYRARSGAFLKNGMTVSVHLVAGKVDQITYYKTDPKREVRIVFVR